MNRLVAMACGAVVGLVAGLLIDDLRDPGVPPAPEPPAAEERALAPAENAPREETTRRLDEQFAETTGELNELRRASAAGQEREQRCQRELGEVVAAGKTREAEQAQQLRTLAERCEPLEGIVAKLYPGVERQEALVRLEKLAAPPRVVEAVIRARTPTRTSHALELSLRMSNDKPLGTVSLEFEALEGARFVEVAPAIDTRNLHTTKSGAHASARFDMAGSGPIPLRITTTWPSRIRISGNYLDTPLLVGP